MQVAFYLAGEITQVKESIPWVRCASGNVFNPTSLNQTITHVTICFPFLKYQITFSQHDWQSCAWVPGARSLSRRRTPLLIQVDFHRNSS